MTEYTPTDQDVETDFSQHQYHCVGGVTPSEAHAEFRLWLAEHDRQVAERAWAEGCGDAEQFYKRVVLGPQFYPKGYPTPLNPYRKEATGD